MTRIIKRPIFMHSFLNPLSEELDCNFDFSIEKPIGKFHLKKIKSGCQTEYSLVINEKSIIGVENHRRRPMNAIRDLVLALNLSLQRTCFSIRQQEMPNIEKLHTPKPQKAKIEKTPKGQKITVSEKLTISCSFHMTLGGKETVSEEEVVDILNKVVLVNRFNHKLDLKYANLSKALNEYEKAMDPSDKLTIFRSLYNSIEFCANWEGTNHVASCLDSEIATIAEIEELTAKSWRELYNRTKHADRKIQHIETLKQSIDTLSSILQEIRKVAKIIIIKRLDQIQTD